MTEEALSQFRSIGMNIAAMIVFFVCFVGIVLWVFRRHGGKYYERMARMPLDEGDRE